jgi:hypothetical protein
MRAVAIRMRELGVPASEWTGCVANRAALSAAMAMSRVSRNT